jgi:plastocyanin
VRHGRETRRTWKIGAAIALGGLLATAAVLSGCGDDPSDDTTRSGGDDPSATAATAPEGGSDGLSVSALEGEGDPRTAWTFEPALITVAVGEEVAFTNDGQEAHTATAEDGSFDTGTLSTGDTESVTFDTGGTFAYQCSLHPWMKGEVIVTPNG